MGATVKFSLNGSPEKIVEAKGINEKLQLFNAYTLFRYMTPFVPMDTGMLSQTVDVQAKLTHGEIHYTQPYAHRLYEGTGLNFNKQMHPLATSYWDKATWTAKKDNILKEVDAYRKRIST